MEERVDDLMRLKPQLTRAQAEREALDRFGDMDQVKDTCSDLAREQETQMRRLEHLDTARQDFGYALRMLRRYPALTAAIVLTLALGIGATTAVFSVVHAVILSP